MDCPLSLADLARVGGGTSVFHFSRAFKNSAGQAPYRYVLLRRIDRAMKLMRSTEMPLAQVASACGFRNIAHLSKAFSRGRLPFFPMRPTRRASAAFVFTLRRTGDELLVRPISARYMHKKEIDAYEKENPDL